jgi:Na+/H+ antiporter NhaC
MLHAERRSRGKSKRADAVASAAPELAAPSGDDVDPLPAGHAPKHLWINSIAPVLIMIAVTVVLLLITGAEKLGEQPHIEPTWFNRFGHGDSYLALVYGSLAGLLAAMLLAWLQRVLPWRKLRAAAFEGARLVLPALTILWLAWALSGLTREQYLGTGTFLGGILTKVVIPQWMPTIVFVLSSLVAFATGTSWGTMGILMPLAISVTYKMLASQQSEVDLHDPLLLASIGSVLAGAIFGDHCSPISDTTILSSQASGCPHMDHVWTQLPYALLVALISILCGTLPAGFGVGVWILVPLGVIVLFVCLLVMGRPVEMKPPPNSI